MKLLNFSSLDKLVGKRKCKHKKYHIFTLTFSSLTYILASSSTEVNLEKERDSAAKKPKRVAIGEPGTSGVSSTSKTRKFKGKDKRKITFSVD